MTGARALREHWPEYTMEAAGLGTFMLSACAFAALLEHPESPVHAALPSDVVRRAVMGLAMGLTAIAIIYSPLGKRSGAHINPAVTLTFLRLGKIAPWDALYYVVAQCAGGIAGVLLAAAILPSAVAHPSVNYVVTAPGAAGAALAFACESGISFVLMLVVLVVSNKPEWERYTGVVAGALVAAYILVEAPFSGMSMNPARTLASAVPSGEWTAAWIYFVAPPCAMLLAAEVYTRTRRRADVHCAKLHHTEDVRCIFCGFFPDAAPARSARLASPKL
jgi:aquaporin Z